ncbi:MAG: hypothetical protein CMO01_27420 [Thalassobius sp.]|nr:hypothetical protein [Thalassovita sp.]
MKGFRHLSFSIFSLLYITVSLHAFGFAQTNLPQIPTPERKAYLTRLIADFVFWPNEEQENNDPFIISVFNDENFFRYLLYLYKDVRFKNRITKIEHITSVDEIDGSQILFVTSTSEEVLEEILNKTKNEPILTIGDQEEFGKKGVIVNFYAEDEEIKFEINFLSYQNSDLQIDSRLFDVARIID